MNYYTPNNIVQIDATFNYIAKAGVGFGILPNNEQVFFSARLVEDLNLQLGDAVRVWAVDNYAAPETSHFASRWRAVRAVITQRLVDTVRVDPNPAPVPPVVAPPALSPAHAGPVEPVEVGEVGAMDDLERMHRAILRIVDDKAPWTVSALSDTLKPEFPNVSNLVSKVTTRVLHMHKVGELASVKVYAKGEQKSASAVYFAKNTDVFYDHLDTPLNDE